MKQLPLIAILLVLLLPFSGGKGAHVLDLAQPSTPPSVLPAPVDFPELLSKPSAVKLAPKPKPVVAPPTNPLFKVAPLPAEIQPPVVAAVQPLALTGLPFSPIGTFANSFPLGQCTYGAASMKGNIPGSWGNANNWADAARAQGLTVTDVPLLGAVAQTSRGVFGHVAVVVAVNPDNSIEITEENFDFMGSVRTRHADPGEFIYIYI